MFSSGTTKPYNARFLVAIREWAKGQILVVWGAAALCSLLALGAYVVWETGANNASTDAGIRWASYHPPRDAYGGITAEHAAVKDSLLHVSDAASEQFFGTKAWLQPLAFAFSFIFVPGAMLAITWNWLGAQGARKRS